MHVRIVSNIDNGKGLERDYQLLRRFLEEAGHEVTGVSFRSTERPRPADLVVFLEVYEPRLAEDAPRRWLVPNVEWWRPEDSALLGDFELVLCKTEDALVHVAPHTPRARYLGFFSEDRLDAGVPRRRCFLHVAGGSIAKGTDSVLAAWERYLIPYPLVVVSWLGLPRRPRSVELAGRVDARRLVGLQNGCLLHLCPSRYEGWGHAIHEGLSTGAAVAVPDAGSTATLPGAALRMPARPAGPQGLVTTSIVEPEDIRDAAERMMAFTDADLHRISRAARDAYLTEREACASRLLDLFGKGDRVVPRGAVPAKAALGPQTGNNASAGASRLVRTAVGIAVPELRGLYGGAVVCGEEAESVAEHITAASGLATRVVDVPGLSALPDDYACGAVLVNVGAAESKQALSQCHRITKAAGPIMSVDRQASPVPSAAGDGAWVVAKRVEYARCARTK